MNLVNHQMYNISDMPLVEGDNVLIQPIPGKTITLTQFQFDTNGDFTLYEAPEAPARAGEAVDTGAGRGIVMTQCQTGSMRGVMKLPLGAGLVLNFKPRTDKETGEIIPGVMNGMLMYY